MNYQSVVELEVPNLDLLEKINQIKLLPVATGMVLVSLIAANLIGTNVLATEGFAMNDVEQRIISLEKENHEMRVKIEESVNLKTIEKLAQSQGYFNAKNIVFTSIPSTTALR